MEELGKNLEAIRRNIQVIKATVIVAACLLSFLLGLLVGLLVSLLVDKVLY